LGIETVDRLILVQAQIELVRHGYRADLSALAAAGAFLQVDVTGLLI